MTKPRDKGIRGEQEVCGILRRCLPDDWTVTRFGTGESGHDVRVTPSVGRWPWALEVKFYGGFDVGQVLRGSALWASWWAQAVRQAEAVGRRPMLITRGNRRPWWVWVHHGPTLDAMPLAYVHGGEPGLVVGYRGDDVWPLLAGTVDHG
jgi:hypothetical protein